MIALGIATLATAAAVAHLSAGSRSVAVAIFYLAFLPFATLDASEGWPVSAEAVATGNDALWKLSVRALVMAGVLALAMRRARAVADVVLRPVSLLIVLLVAWAMLGMPRASDPWVAFFRLGELFAFFVAGIVLYVEVTRNPRTHDVARIHALALVAPLVAAVVLAHVQPEVAFHESSGDIRRMGHKFVNSNVLGFCAAVVLLWATYGLRTARIVSAGLPGLLAVCAIAALPLLATDRRIALGDVEERSAWTPLFAFQCMVALASVTVLWISGYPNVAMLFHYGLFAFATRPPSLSTEERLSARSATLPLHKDKKLAYAGE